MWDNSRHLNNQHVDDSSILDASICSELFSDFVLAHLLGYGHTIFFNDEGQSSVPSLVQRKDSNACFIIAHRQQWLHLKDHNFELSTSVNFLMHSFDFSSFAWEWIFGIIFDMCLDFIGHFFIWENYSDVDLTERNLTFRTICTVFVLAIFVVFGRLCCSWESCQQSRQ